MHCKLVETAKNMGYSTVVVDYLPVEKSPAKQLADEYYQIDINDVKTIDEFCNKQNVKGVISTHLDPCQRPYGKICSDLGLPCLWNNEQIELFSNKSLFKKECIKNGLAVTEEYMTSRDDIEYPVFIKPVDSRGSRGQIKAQNELELKKGILTAELESRTGKYIIERYYERFPEIQATYFLKNGESFLIRTTDSYRGKDSLENVITYAVSPSCYDEAFKSLINKDIKIMLKKLGIKNGPVMMQGFWDNGKFRIFDQGLRFPGVDYERIIYSEFRLNLLESLIEYAFSGKMADIDIDESMTQLNGKKSIILFPVLKPGKIAKIDGIKKIKELDGVISVICRKYEGDIVSDSNSIDRRLAEIDIIGDDEAQVRDRGKKIMSLLHVVDSNGNDMMLPYGS